MLSLSNIGRKLFGSANDRRIKRYAPMVDRINGLEPEFEALSDDEIFHGPGEQKDGQRRHADDARQ